MKRKLLRELGLTEKQVACVMREYGKSVVSWKEKYSAYDQKAIAVKQQLLITQQKLAAAEMIFKELQQIMSRLQSDSSKKEDVGILVGADRKLIVEIKET